VWSELEVQIGNVASINANFRGEPPTEFPSEFIRRVNDGVWSCLWIGDHVWSHSPDKVQLSRFMLVVEWQDAGTAVRVGSLVLEYFERHRVNGLRPLVRDEDMQWVKVRLI